ncbi:MAG TPA: hypothetical protein PKA28_10925 [Methylomusa anaerophila]|uniref:Uncharacterized protein n=1 Tax=Methylomusa anaerophila TaxID=1930071 RepID=A0A348AJ25_9FIRM|nr:hypothetical protein [Methylomusa anaerophila]BBB91073.1 hypothetical protein MAMMFC1_01741 [Methylomusa anaerophila]HML88948.1 hypothetical protein [Methylomusa anaerophila]
MTNEELGKEIALGIINTGVEGGFDAVSCSTAGDYPSIGCSQWEGLNGRGDALLNSIPGGDYFADRTYSDIQNNGELEALRQLLGSEEGQAVQIQILSQNCTEMYVNELLQVPSMDDSRCFIYAGIWCPTSHSVVRRFLQNRWNRYNLRSLETMRDIFRDLYYVAASVGEEYAVGYANRAENTFQYVASLNLSAYGVAEYGQGPFGR